MFAHAHYDDFSNYPVEKWALWIEAYLKERPVTFNMFHDFVEITCHNIDAQQTQALLEVCLLTMKAAADTPNAFEEFVLPLVAQEKWSVVGQMISNASRLDQNVCDTLVAPLWSHPQTTNLFVTLNEHIRKQNLWKTTPLLHPKILSQPRLQRKFQMMPVCLGHILNQPYLTEYGQKGLENLKTFGLLSEQNHSVALALTLCMDSSVHLKQLNTLVSIDFSDLPALAKMHLGFNSKALEFYPAILNMCDEKAARFIVCDSICRYLQKPDQTTWFGLLKQSAQKVRWDEELVRDVLLYCGTAEIGECLSTLIDIIPTDACPLIEEYFSEGGFKVSEELKAKAQKMTLLHNVVGRDRLSKKTTRKL